MTLIIALKCRNGIVVASDGQATALSSGGPVRQKIQKIFQLGSNVIFGASGSVGTMQTSFGFTPFLHREHMIVLTSPGLAEIQPRINFLLAAFRTGPYPICLRIFRISASSLYLGNFVHSSL